MKATVLVDNIPSAVLCGEWGLSIYVEYNGKNILLDAGAGPLFAENAEKLGLSVADVDFAVLSHAHYDHADGMPRFFELNSRARFYLREGSGEDCYKRPFIRSEYIGLPKGVLTEYADRIEMVSGDFELCEGVWLVPHKTAGLSAMGKRDRMFRKTPRGRFADDFSHEQSLVFDTPEGLVIFNSCSHGGAANIINEVAATFPGRPLRALIGGFHLFNKTETEILELAGKIRETGIATIYTGHCTGEKALGVLRDALGVSVPVNALSTGLVMEF